MNNIPVDTTDIEAHCADPDNRQKLFPVPTGAVGAGFHHPGAPILPEALGDWVMEEQFTPWEVLYCTQEDRGSIGTMR